jgi:predicted metal-dependent phosphoesterase TrpH
MKHLIPQTNYYKTALHCHTNISDGLPSPEEMKEIYKSKGYQVLSITDHNILVDHSALNEEDFLLLTGAEYNIN